MTDPRPPSRTALLAVTVAVLIVCFVLIWRLVLAGDPANSLHTSALAWAFSLCFATVGAYLGFDALAAFRSTSTPK